MFSSAMVYRIGLSREKKLVGLSPHAQDSSTDLLLVTLNWRDIRC